MKPSLGATQGADEAVVLYARDIVESDFISLDGEVSAFDAVQLMKKRRHGFIILSTPDGKPYGIVTEWDYISKVAAEGKDPSKVKLSEIMSGNLVMVGAGWGIDQVSQVMAEKGIRRVLVLKDEKVIGVITARTMLATLKAYVDSVSADIARLQVRGA